MVRGAHVAMEYRRSTQRAPARPLATPPGRPYAGRHVTASEGAAMSASTAESADTVPRWVLTDVPAKD